jgi:hypothetical protein
VTGPHRSFRVFLGLAALAGLPALVFQLLAPAPRVDADAIEYYAHLRSLYFDADVRFDNEFRHFGILERWDKTNPTLTGYRRTNFSVGPALMWMPFYAVGDGIARLRGDAEDGYSDAHRRAAALGSWFWGLAGLLLAFDLARRVTGEGAAYWAALALMYGTFLFWYVAYEPLASHAVSFFTGALVLWLWWPGAVPSGGRAAAIGLAIGLAACVRWQNALHLVLPATTLLASMRRAPRRSIGLGVLVLAAFALAVLPQLLVFRAVFGQWLLDAPLQGRDYLRLERPALLEVLFSSRHGLLYWTPLLWAGLAGLAALVRRQPLAGTASILLVASTTWVNASAGDWWGGGSFSSRRFDSVLPILALGMALVLESLRRALWRRPALVLAVAVGSLSVWNLLFMRVYRDERIPRDDTVSFAVVTERIAEALSAATGTPLAWPANWVFAARHDLAASQYDLMVGKYLFHRQNNLGGRIDLGDERADPALLGEGWGPPQPCQGAVCREVRGRARVFAPLYNPSALDLTVRAAGSGSLLVAFNGYPLSRVPLEPGLTERTLRVPRALTRRELNEVALTVAPEDHAVVDQLQFLRSGEAR